MLPLSRSTTLVILSVVAGIGLHSAIAAPPSAPDGFKWQAFADLTDEFNGTALDMTKWRTGLTYWDGRPPSKYSWKNVTVSDGKLRLKSTSRVKSLSEVRKPNEDIWVSAACVSSRKYAAYYGYYETRIRASRLSMTSSFWFQGKYSEIDVVEQLGRPVNDAHDRHYMLMNTHSFKNGWENDVATPVRWRMPAPAGARFHVYGMWWKDKNTIWFYHDGTKVAEVKPHAWFLEPMLMIFDTEVFWWSGLPSIESLNDPLLNTMEVDWVRAWKLAPVK